MLTLTSLDVRTLSRYAISDRDRLEVLAQALETASLNAPLEVKIALDRVIESLRSEPEEPEDITAELDAFAGQMGDFWLLLSADRREKLETAWARISEESAGFDRATPKGKKAREEADRAALAALDPDELFALMPLMLADGFWRGALTEALTEALPPPAEQDGQDEALAAFLKRLRS